MFGLFFTDDGPVTNYEQATACNQEQFNAFFHAMLERGVYLAPSAFEAGFVSAAHGDAEIDADAHAADLAAQLHAPLDAAKAPRAAARVAGSTPTCAAAAMPPGHSGRCGRPCGTSAPCPPRRPLDGEHVRRKARASPRPPAPRSSRRRLAGASLRSASSSPSPAPRPGPARRADARSARCRARCAPGDGTAAGSWPDRRRCRRGRTPGCSGPASAGR
jgi:hypothetical protein